VEGEVFFGGVYDSGITCLLKSYEKFPFGGIGYMGEESGEEEVG